MQWRLLKEIMQLLLRACGKKNEEGEKGQLQNAKYWNATKCFSRLGYDLTVAFFSFAKLRGRRTPTRLQQEA